MKIFDVLLAVLGDGLLLALLVIIIRRRLHGRYLFFFAYLVFSLLAVIPFFLAIGHRPAAFYVYWLTDGFNALFVLFALNEAFYDIFRRFYSFWWFRLIFPLVVAVTGLLAVRQAFIKPFSRHILVSICSSINGAVSLIEAGTFVTFMLLAVGLRLRWQRYPYYVAMGFAISSVGDWTAYALASYCGSSLAYRYLPPVTYICATLVWLWCFSGKCEPEPSRGFGRTSSASRYFDAVRHLN